MRIKHALQYIHKTWWGEPRTTKCDSCIIYRDVCDLTEIFYRRKIYIYYSFIRIKTGLLLLQSKFHILTKWMHKFIFIITLLNFSEFLLNVMWFVWIQLTSGCNVGQMLWHLEWRAQNKTGLVLTLWFRILSFLFNTGTVSFISYCILYYETFVL